MPHTRDHDGDVRPNGTSNTMTQESGYTPVSQMNTNRHAVSETVERLERRADERIERAAERVHDAAEKLRERAYRREGIAADAGTKVADTLEKTADYLQGHDSEEIFSDVTRYVRRHPLQATAGAVVAGFVLGRLFG